MNGQQVKKSRAAQTFVDLITLVYHEGRGVRRLVENGSIKCPHRYGRLTAQPRDRYEAWRDLQEPRGEARAETDERKVESLYSQRFGLTLEDMRQLFEHSCWEGSRFGGKRWAAITGSVIMLRDALVHGLNDEADKLADQTLNMCHNTGRVIEKLKELDGSHSCHGI